MSKQKSEIDILVSLDLTNLKSKLKRKILKQIKKSKINILVDVDINGLDEDDTNIYSDAVAVSKKPKKNKKK
jgi:hypothetical protein